MIALAETKRVLATAEPARGFDGRFMIFPARIPLKRGDDGGGMGKPGQAVAESGAEAF